MKKLLTIFLLLTLMLVSAVFAAPEDPTVTLSGNSVSINPGASATVVANLNFKPGTSLSGSLSASTLSLTSGSNSMAVLAASISGSSATFVVNAGATQAPGTYTGSFTSTLSYTNTTGAVVPVTITSSVTVTVNTVPSVSFSPTTVNIYGEPGDNPFQIITIRNTGNVVLSNLQFSHDFTNLRDSNDNEVVLRITSDSGTDTVSNLAVGGQINVKVQAELDSGFDIKTFNGNFRAKSDQMSTYQTIPLNIKIQPAACINGPTSRIDAIIEEPSASDEFGPGDEITMEVRVRNRDSDDQKIYLSAYLYNTDRDRKVATYKTSKTIDNGEETTFRFKLKMDDNARSTDDYKVFVKAYVSGEEELFCDNRDIDIDLVIPEDKVIIDSFLVSPLTLSCQESASGLVSYKNVGENDQNVIVRLTNSYLGINEQTSVNLLSDSDENVGSQRFSFVVPKYAKAGSYVIQASVTYTGITITKEQTITVTECAANQLPVVTQVPTNNNQNAVQPVLLTSVQQKDIFDRFNQSIDTPTTFWLLADALLVVGIFVLLVFLLRRRH